MKPKFDVARLVGIAVAAAMVAVAAEVMRSVTGPKAGKTGLFRLW